jgi:NADH:ubiquinone oxidoreductase subunit C
MSNDLAAELRKMAGVEKIEERVDGLWVLAPTIDVAHLAKWMEERSARLSTMSGVARADGETTIVYHYSLETSAVNVTAVTKGNTIASITPVTLAADWIEREIYDLYGVTFTGHPHLTRLIRPPQVAQGFFREEGGISHWDKPKA